MKVLAGHHMSPELFLTLDVVACIAVGAGLGWFIGLVAGNIGVGVSIGVMGGLVVGITTGTIFMNRTEE